MPQNITPSDWINILIFIMTLGYSLILYQKVRRRRIVLIVRKHFSKDINMNLIEECRNINYITKFQQDKIFHLDGTLLFYGDHDISSAEIFHPITLKFEDNDTEILQHQIVGHTDLLNCETQTNNNSLEFITDLLKSNDFIHFSLVYKSKNCNFSIIQRILNFHKKVKIVDQRFVESTWFLTIIYIASIIFFLGMLVAVTENDIFNFSKIRGGGRLLYPLLLNSTLLTIIALWDLFQIYKYKKFS